MNTASLSESAVWRAVAENAAGPADMFFVVVPEPTRGDVPRIDSRYGFPEK